MQYARLHVDPFKVGLQVVHQLVSKRAQGGVSREPELVAQPFLPEKLDVVLCPLVRLRSASDRVVHDESKLPVPRLRGSRLRQVHLCQLSAEFCLTVASTDIEIVHDYERARALLQISVVQDVGHEHCVCRMHRTEALRLAGKHVICGPRRRLDEEFPPRLCFHGLARRPAGPSTAAGGDDSSRAGVLLNPPRQLIRASHHRHQLPE
mmetsp:Transcript_3873/g.11570  ORF Transcript_3873/g.11570 Transcript_3873/m.11570 type:complete len:207 (+) Transcript_3873:541-1161(+)